MVEFNVIIIEDYGFFYGYYYLIYFFICVSDFFVINFYRGGCVIF